MEKEIKLTSGRLKLLIEPSSCGISLFWNGVKLTKDSGFISIIGAENSGRYYSDKALWQVEKVSADKLEVQLK